MKMVNRRETVMNLVWAIEEGEFLRLLLIANYSKLNIDKFPL